MRTTFRLLGYYLDARSTSDPRPRQRERHVWRWSTANLTEPGRDRIRYQALDVRRLVQPYRYPFSRL